MAEAVAARDFDKYYAANLAFHDVYLGRSDNKRLLAQVHLLKQRLYDWPRREAHGPVLGSSTPWSSTRTSCNCSSAAPSRRPPPTCRTSTGPSRSRRSSSTPTTSPASRRRQ